MSSEQAKSKNRGRSNEYQLVDQLKKLGVPDASRVPLSGALKSLPGDVDAPSISTLFEAKVIGVQEVEGAKYVRINLSWIGKIFDEAKRLGRDRGVVVVRGRNLQKRYVVMELEQYVSLCSTVSLTEP